MVLSTAPFLCAEWARAADESLVVGQSTMQSGGVERIYRVHVPPSYDGEEPVPLIVAIHFGGGNSQILERLSQLSEYADQKGFLVAYPEGYRTAWGGPDLVTPSVRDGVDDAAFISAVIDRVAGEYRVDPRRVYVAGMCNGSLLAQVVGYELADKVAAVALYTAFMTEAFRESYETPPRPMPIIQFNGTADTYILWDGGIPPGLGNNGLPVRVGVERWAEVNGCSKTPEVTELPDVADDGTKSRREVYGDCVDGAEVVLYVVEGAGHTWPGGVPYASEDLIGKTSQDMSANEAMWEFFLRHPLPAGE
jgi:polyhydroxybutyrate depolymerase